MNPWREQVERLEKELDRLKSEQSGVEQQQQRLETGDLLKDDYAQNTWDSLERQRASLSGQVKETERELSVQKNLATAVEDALEKVGVDSGRREPQVEIPTPEQKASDAALAAAQAKSEQEHETVQAGIAKHALTPGETPALGSEHGHDHTPKQEVGVLEGQVKLIEELNPPAPPGVHIPRPEIEQQVQRLVEHPVNDGPHFEAPPISSPDAAALMVGGMVAAHMGAIVADKLGDVIEMKEALQLDIRETLHAAAEKLGEIREAVTEKVAQITGEGYEGPDLEALRERFAGMHVAPPPPPPSPDPEEDVSLTP